MRVPLLLTFMPQIIITLVLGVTSIVIFNSMHHDAVTNTMRTSLDRSMQYVEERVAAPFRKQRDDARVIRESMRITGSSGYRGDGQPTYAQPVTPTSLLLVEHHLKDMWAMQLVSNGTYAYIYQQFRISRRPDWDPASRDVDAWDWGWTGIAPTYVYHNINASHVAYFSNGVVYPNFTTTDMYAQKENASSYSLVQQAKNMHRDTSPDGAYTSLTAWIGSFDGIPTIMYSFTLPVAWDPVTGYTASHINVDINCGRWLPFFVRDLNIPETEVTVMHAGRRQILASSFDSLTPNMSAAVFQLLDPYDAPEPRLTAAISALEGEAGSLAVLGEGRTVIVETKSNDDIYSARALREYGVDLVMVAITKRGYFFSDGERTARDAIITCVMLLVAAFVVAIVTAVLLARPLSDLGERMALTASLQDDGTELNPSLVMEVGEMQDAYEIMKRELFRMKSFLPQSVLQMDDDDDDEEGSVTASNTNTNTNSNVEKRSEVSSLARSSVRDDTSSRGSSARGARGAAALNLATALTAKRVTVAVFNLVGFHKVVRGSSIGAVARLQADFLRLVVDKSREQRGVVDSFQGDHVVVTWNAVKMVASSARRAATAATEAVKAAMAHATMPALSVGIAQGDGVVGNSGIEEMKRFNVMAGAFSHAMALERMAAARVNDQTRKCVLVGRHVMLDIETAFHVRCVDIAPLSRDAKPIVVTELQKPRDNVDEDEWMYELQNSEAGNSNGVVNMAYLALEGGNMDDFNAALTKIQDEKVCDELNAVAQRVENMRVKSLA